MRLAAVAGAGVLALSPAVAAPVVAQPAHHAEQRRTDKTWWIWHGCKFGGQFREFSHSGRMWVLRDTCHHRVRVLVDCSQPIPNTTYLARGEWRTNKNTSSTGTCPADSIRVVRIGARFVWYKCVITSNTCVVVKEYGTIWHN